MKVFASLISHFSSLAQKEGGINFAQGRPGYPPPEGLLKFLKKLVYESNLHQYAPGKGDFFLLAETEKIYKKIYQNLKKENILITLGGTEGIALSLIFLLNEFKNFSLLSFEPFYESYPRISKFLNIPVFSVKIDPFNLKWSREKVKKLVKEKNAKGILLASPGNPLGKIFKEEEVNFLRDLMKKRKGFLIFDGVYENVYFEERPFNPLKDGFENLIFISSYSKTLSITGWRIGYLIAEEKVLEKISSIHDYTHLSSPYILQRAIAQFLKREKIGNYLKVLRENLKSSYILLKGQLESFGFKVSKAEGGMFGWLQIPEKYKDSFIYAEKLFLRKKVAVVPGINFSKNAKNFIRINLSLPLEEFREGIERIKEFEKEN